jgi:membrane-associated phospholipid phosphatase
VSRATAAIAATVAAFAVLATLVVTGALQAVDQYAVDHWMANFEPSSGSIWGSLSHQFYPHLGSPLQVFCNLWTFPASVFVTGVVLVTCCVALVRRGQRAAALAWFVAWLAANFVEVVGKLVLHRPALHAIDAGMRVWFSGFSHSFPSGHALRATLTAALLATVWKRATLPAFAWTVVVFPTLVVGAAHTPTDIVGGALVALIAILSVRAYLGARVVTA